MSWHKATRKSDVLVLVEDQMSAIKLSPHCHAAALLGTHISDDKVKEIVAGGYKKVVISLDNDATYTAIKAQLALRRTIDGLFVHGLEKDIKNMNREEFAEYVSSVLS